MKFLKGGNLLKLVAFFVIAAILTCTVAFASNGWQSFVEDEPDSDDEGGNNTDNNVDENTDGTPGGDEPVVQPAPVFYHYLTGEIVSPELANERPIGFVYSSTDPNYAISSAYLTVEIPIENGDTRLIGLFSASEYLGKIGSIAPTRDYFSPVANSLGCLLIHHGNDDSFEYSSNASVDNVDLCEQGGYYYTEYTNYRYSNGDLISALLKNTGKDTVANGSVKAPFSFAEIGSPDVRGGSSASTVVLPYSDANTTQLVYDHERGGYVLYKSTEEYHDLLNDKACVYDNAFILYADATTYESAEATETVIDTESGGVGYYFTRGTVIRINWSTEGGSLVFTDESGKRLTVNRGTSYIAFEKASKINLTTYN